MSPTKKNSSSQEELPSTPTVTTTIDNDSSKASVTLYNFGYAPKEVIEKFQSFCINYPTLTAAIHNLLLMDKNLKYKYRFLTSSVTYQMLARPTVKDDTQVLKNAILKLHKYAKDGRYKSVSDAIEELLMSSSKQDPPSSVESNNSTQFTMDWQVKKSLEVVVEAVYTKILDNLYLSNQQEANKQNMQPVRSPSIRPSYSPLIIPQTTKVHQVPMNDRSRFLSVRGASNQQRFAIPIGPAVTASVKQPIQPRFPIQKIPFSTSANIRSSLAKQPLPVLPNTQKKEDSKKRSALSSTPQLQEVKKARVEPETKKKEERKEVRPAQRNSSARTDEVISLLEDDDDVEEEEEEETDSTETISVKSEIVEKRPLLNPICLQSKNKIPPKNRQNELALLIQADIKGEPKKKELLEDCGLISKDVISKYQEKYPYFNKLR